MTMIHANDAEPKQAIRYKVIAECERPQVDGSGTGMIVLSDDVRRDAWLQIRPNVTINEATARAVSQDRAENNHDHRRSFHR